VIDFFSDIISKEKFDIVHADHSSMAPFDLLCKSVQNIPAGLRLHNIEWIIWQRYAERFSKLSPQRFYLEKQAIALKKSESEFLKKMDVSFSITEIDRNRALELAPEANIITAKAGVNPDAWKPDESITKNKNELILATTYDWIHNIDAVKWFVNQVLPKVKTKIPEIKLTLLGKFAPEWLKNYKDIGVNVVGYVDKVQPYLNKANIYISPLFVGGGIRIKILEAMAMSLPVVATPVAAEGINATIESGLFISQNENEFAENIIKLIQNPELVQSAGKAAREFILREHSWEKNVEIIMNEYQRLAEQYKKS
jgi:glycosyltransferase involved in cell wall biosynthesis